MTPALVLITGTGRSGTSTMSGTLHHLGLYVPGPYLGANPSNPKGFFESKWAIEFHKNIARQAGIDDFDSRPAAFERAQAAVTPEIRARLVQFLREQSAGHDQVVVKDPRSVWVQALWKDAATEAGLGIRYISMLRHPAEVVGSRSAYYAKKADEDRRRAYEVISVARWVNSSLISERETRGEPRSFVGYVELLEDWRPVLARVRDELSLTFATDLDAGERHAVDDFIDPDLRRLRVTWDDLEVPRDLREVAQEVWDALESLRDAGGTDPEVSARLDALADDYRRVLAQAVAMSHDAIAEARAEGQEKGAREARAALRSERAHKRTAAGPQNRRIGDVGGRDLLREAARRAWRRVRRRPSGGGR